MKMHDTPTNRSWNPWVALAASSALLLAAPAAKSAEPVPSFSTEIQPILTKFGCNQGSCHGAQFGKGGFKLSLRGFDDAADYYEIVKSVAARRVQFTDPA